MTRALTTIRTAAGQQLIVCAAFDDVAVLDDQDHVGRPDRRETVGDHDRGPACQRVGERLLHRGLRSRDQRRGGLVEHHDPGAAEALDPQRVVLLPDGTEDFWSADYRDLIELA